MFSGVGIVPRKIELIPCFIVNMEVGPALIIALFIQKNPGVGQFPQTARDALIGTTSINYKPPTDQQHAYYQNYVMTINKFYSIISSINFASMGLYSTYKTKYAEQSIADTAVE